MRKNGFSIVEVAVTCVIVILIGIAIASTCLISSSNASKSKTLHFAVNEIENIQKIFSSSSIETAGEVDYTHLQDAVKSFYSDKAECDLSEKALSIKLFLDDKYSITTESNSFLNVKFDCVNNCVLMSAQVVHKNNNIYENARVFKRWI